MCYSSHTDFFSKGLPTFNNPDGENHKKLSQNKKKPVKRRESTDENFSNPP